MKIGFIFGKGIDGCGVTKGANLFESWAVEQGHETHILDVNNDVTYFRAQLFNWKGTVYEVNPKEEEIPDDIVDLFNSFDIVIIHSLPIKKQSAYVERFRRFFNKITNPIIVMHDHSISATNSRNVPQCGELFSQADILVLQSLDGHAKELYSSYDPNIADRVLENPIWVDLEYYKRFMLPFEERENNIIYLGRMSSLKDPAYICRIEPHMDDKWNFSLVGCEHSIAAARLKEGPYQEHLKKKIKSYRFTKKNGLRLHKSGAQEEDDVRIESYDSYPYEFGMEKLSKSLFSWNGYNLKNTADYGNRMEYTTIESFILTVPIIHRHFAENAYSPEGKLWGEYEGPIISEGGKEEETSKFLEELSRDKEEWNRRFKATTDLITKFNDINNMAPKYLNAILSMGKRENKVDVFQKICDQFPHAKKLRDQGEVIVTTRKFPFKKLNIIKDGKFFETSNK